MRIVRNVLLAKHSTFHIGGPADYFCKVKSLGELKEAIQFANSKKLPIFVLGGGSNLMFSDEGFRGLVIKIEILGIKFYKPNRVEVGAGYSWDKLVGEVVGNKLYGIENLSLVPGTVGGAVCQNIGAYGAELKDILVSVSVFDPILGKIRKLSNKQCRFSYRDSLFLHKEGKRLIILSATLKLSKKPSFNIKYPDLEKYFEGKKPDLAGVRRAIVKIRRSKLVYPTKKIGTAGSFFKNPVISRRKFSELLKSYPDLKGRESGGKIKLFAGQLIEIAGWKGRRLDDVGVSKTHALVLVNYGKGTASSIMKLAGEIVVSVWDRFRIKLEPEVRII